MDIFCANSTTTVPAVEDPINDGSSPTAAPTPESTVSWQSRFMFWIWITSFLGGTGGMFGN